jgi:crotonobetainyl-CoA:carnitine CoA-transferase CaiB-like acyl-CoA transferase
MSYSFIKNLKVVELSNVLAGPAVGMFFAELGATVIKVENKTTGGDMTRKWKLPVEDESSNVSAYFASVNYHKEYLQIDFNNLTDNQKVIDLIQIADIVIVNFKKGDDVKFGFDYEKVKELNPAIIYAHITGYGNDVEKTAFDIVLQAETGFMHMNGTISSGPVKMPVALIDILAAHQLKEAILLALIKRQISETGSYVHVSLYETAIASLANQASNYLMTGSIAQPMGTLHPNIAPYGEIIICKDGVRIILAVGSDSQFKSLCTCLALDNVFINEKFATNKNRINNRGELNELLNSKAADEMSAPLSLKLTASKVPHGFIKNMQQVFENETAKKMILEEEIEGINTRRVSTIAFKKDFLND